MPVHAPVSRWDELVQTETRRFIEQAAEQLHRRFFNYPRTPMFIIFTKAHGVEPILFRTREAAEAEIARLQEWAAYRELHIGVAEIDFGYTSLASGQRYALESIL